MSFSKFTDEFNKLINSSGLKKALATKSKDIIFKRVKAGFGVDNDFSPSPRKMPLKKLSPEYIEKRRRSQLGKFGSPRRSNATLSGQMLDSLTFKITREGFEIFPKNNGRRPIIVAGTRVRQRLSNQQVSFFYSIERPYLALTVEEQRIVTQEFDKLITDNFKSKKFTIS